MGQAHYLIFQAMFLLSAQLQSLQYRQVQKALAQGTALCLLISLLAIVSHCTCTSMIQRHEMLLAAAAFEGLFPSFPKEQAIPPGDYL